MTVVLLFGKPIVRWGKRLEEIMRWWRLTLQNGVKQIGRRLRIPIQETILSEFVKYIEKMLKKNKEIGKIPYIGIAKCGKNIYNAKGARK